MFTRVTKIITSSTQSFLKNPVNLVFTVLVVSYFAIALFQGSHIGVTTDEYAHIGAIDSYSQGQGLNPEHPLGQKILGSLWYQIWFDESRIDSNIDAQYARGAAVLTTYPGAVLLIRLVFIMTNAVVLVWLWLMVRKGWLDAVFGYVLAGLYVFSPPIISHTPLVTFDVAGATSVLMLVTTLAMSLYRFVDWKDVPLRVMLLNYLLLFWTLNTKFSNVIVLPIFALWLGLIIYRYYLAGTWKEFPFKVNLYLILALMAVQYVVYAWAFRNADPLILDWNDWYLDRDSYGSVWALLWDGLTPFFRYLQGVFLTSSRTTDVTPPFLFGKYREISLLHFGTLIFWFKENPVFLVSIGVLLGFALYHLYRFWKGESDISIRVKPWIIVSMCSILILYPLMYAVIAGNRYLVIGYRHLYPLTVFVYLLFAWSWSRLVHKITPWLTFILLAGLGIFGAFGSWANISYSNPFYQGSRIQFVNDSSYNWAQGYKHAYLYIGSQTWPESVGVSGFPPGISASNQFVVETGQRDSRLELQDHDFFSEYISANEYDYFVLDSYTYQLLLSDQATQIGFENLAYLTNFEVVYNYQEVTWVYQLRQV
jgi:hypothetical protein